MPQINEINQERIVVKSVGGFAHSLQQIAAGRMTRLRKVVEASRRFVDEATLILRELELERTKQLEKELGVKKAELKSRKKPQKGQQLPPEQLNIAIIVVTSNQGLAGSYNTDIIKKADPIIEKYKDADYFVLGTKGQAFFAKAARKHGLAYYPYNIPEEVTLDDLRPLIGMFYHYDQIFLLYSKYVNTVIREVVFVELTVPNIIVDEAKKEQVEGKFIFEPNVDELIKLMETKLRYALFRQQILDSKLALYSSQMMAMKTASDNAGDLLKELQLQYNKARRKLIDKKIQEVQAGRSLWADEE